MAGFAALLRELKERTDRSYGSLARRLNMNTSTLHRYCAGEAVPVDFAPVERFAALCGATGEERLELHRRWLHALQARQRPRTTDGPASTGTPTGSDPEPDSSPEPGSGSAAATSPGRATETAPRPESATAFTPRTGTEPASRTNPATDSATSGSSGHGAEAAVRREAGGRALPGASPVDGETAGADPEGAGEPDADAVTGRPATPVDLRRAAEPAGAPDAPSGPALPPRNTGSRTAGGAASGPVTGAGGAVSTGASAPAAGPASDTAVVSGPRPRGTGDAGKGPRPWYRRRKRVAVALAAACALLATVGSLSALPDGGTASGGHRTPGGAAHVSPTAGPVRTPHSRAPSPSPTPSGPRPDPGSRSRSATPAPGADSPGPGPASTSPVEPKARPAAGPPPLTWSADSHVWAHGCGHDYVVAKPPKLVPPPPAPQDAATWAGTQSAVHGGETIVELSVQGTSDTAVVLTALRVRVAGRAGPAPGNAYAMDQGCGGALTPRYFDVDLDKDRPIARAVAGNDAGTPIPAVRMPYRVSATDPEVLIVTARTAGCDCRWYLELDWSSQGRSGTVRVDDHGRPFRTSGIQGLPRYEYDTSARDWRSRTE
uniref:transcriptional regulator n=1 Tax=Streptomyces sp. CHD11 TaxID=2741325 RepID=UPI0027E4B740|nr:helix-turn-helix domain-containing protein [Streptomyces sp. CHD11]